MIMIYGESESPNFRRAVYKGNRNAIPSLVSNEELKQLSASPLATPGWPIGPTSQLSRSSGYGPRNVIRPIRVRVRVRVRARVNAAMSP